MRRYSRDSFKCAEEVPGAEARKAAQILRRCGVVVNHADDSRYTRNCTGRCIGSVRAETVCDPRGLPRQLNAQLFRLTIGGAGQERNRARNERGQRAYRRHARNPKTRGSFSFAHVIQEFRRVSK